MKKIQVLHGPNLNLLGMREPMLYGQKTLSNINDELKRQASLAGFMLTAMQSNSEAELIDSIHKSLAGDIDYMIINPAAYTHTSIAMRDALLAVNIPFIEVHISNIHTRESFRSQSYFSDISQGVITGLGTDGYLFALQAITTLSKRESN
ncbi:MAG: type II 3-dehydroquinate dehydratase [Legionellaceae bacterium]|nr:type II 3-dehydroquinate dehydratase [Legionellaceae bacterium]